MTPRLVSDAERLAGELGGDSGVVKGPLKGYHHETYVLCPPGGTRMVKVREPRARILWFDRRCFRSEEQLLRALHGHISRIPDILDVEGMELQGFIEGRTVGRRLPWDRRVPDTVFDQIVELFREMALITPDTLSRLKVERRCGDTDRADEGDCDGFLERLIAFSEERIFEENRARYGGLFDELGVTGESFALLRKRVSGLKQRPFCLLHADLHRENLIVDAGGRLWTIDWELAMLGDPLYDLATHLHLMRYPADQERRMTRAWCEVVERVRPGGSRGWQDDLPLILDFKKAQSVFTDVIRGAQSLLVRDGTAFNWAGLPLAALKLRKVLENAAEPLGLRGVPGHSQITGALVSWHRTREAERSDGPREDRNYL
ncbi:aminoglycoside phosphotransferase family protein [Streptomyces graminilatus]|uniref:aminoglycoside phosphotransferase family protein n=1 Tax=Streptomyces graminilatus TaxID=1464070 RepID=UPI0006E2DA08|nr:aminoglycoside phosphotransferase family protein [Streptomyces graminilatus]